MPRFTVTFDTCVLFDQRDRWQGTQPAFRALLDLVEAREADLILPDVIQCEGHKLIKRLAGKIHAAHEVCQAAIGGEKRTESDICEILVRHFDDICARAKILSTSHITADRVLGLYWDGKPPFDKRAKRSEFPDAFALLALQDWANLHGPVIVVSSDSDWRRTCTGALQYFQTLETLLASRLVDPLIAKAAQALRGAMTTERIRDRMGAQIDQAIGVRVYYKANLLDPGRVFIDTSLTFYEISDVRLYSIDEPRDDVRHVAAIVCVKLKLRLNCSVPRPDSDKRTWDDCELEIAKHVECTVEYHVNATYDPRTQSCAIDDLILRNDLEFDFELVSGDRWALRNIEIP